MYRLVEGASIDAYLKWNESASAEVRELMPSVGANWQMYQIEETAGEGPNPTWTLVETIELEDWREWTPAWTSNERLVEIWAEFGQWIDTDTLRVVYGRKIFGQDF